MRWLGGVLVFALLVISTAHAATYNLPAQIGSFAGCSFISGTTYTCTGNLTLGNNDSINFTSAMTLQVNGNFIVGNNSNLNNSGGYAVAIVTNGNIVLGNSNYAAINFTAGGNFESGNTASITGNISAGGNVVLGNGSTVNGNVTAGGNLQVGSGSVINGNCTYSSTNYTCVARTLSIDSVSTTEGNSGTKTLTFAVTLSPAASSTVTVNYASSNGTATTADSDYVAKSGALSFTSGQSTKSIVVTINGDTKYEANETFTVTLSGASGATIATASGTGTITNDDTAPTLSIAAASLTEGNTGSSNMTFTVTLSAASGLVTTATYATTAGTATAGTCGTAGVDYGTTTGTVTIAAGATTGTFTVPICGDTTYEANETFTVTLSAPSNATLGTSTATGTINNNDATPSLSIASASVTEGNSGTTSLSFTVTLSSAAGLPVTVNYATSNVSATGGASCPGADYVTIPGSPVSTLTLAAGATSGTINVSVCGDTTPESDETLTVTLSAPTNATLGTSSATGTILNDDLAPVAEYRFDECSQYTGVAGQVVDTRSTYPGTPTGGLQNATPGQIQRYANFSTPPVYVNVPAGPVLTNWTFSVWFKKPFAGSGTHSSRYYNIGSVSGGGDFMYLDRNSNYRWGVYSVGAGGGTTNGTFQFGTLSDGWHHLVIVGSGSTTSLYIDGTYRDQVARKTSGTFRYLGTSFDDAGHATNGQSFGTPLDEFKIFNINLSAAQVTQLYNNELAGNNWDGSTRTNTCSCTLGSFRITQTATALACPDTRATVTVEPMCADGTTVKNDYAGTVNLSTAPTGGSYFNAASGGSSISALTFIAGDLSKTAYVYYPNEGSVCAVASDGSVTTTSTSCTSFHAYGFRVSSQPVDVACGNTTTLTLTAYGKNESGAGCTAITNFTGNKNLKAWFTSGIDPDNPTTAQGSNRTLSITGSASGISDKIEPATANLTNVPFSSGVATLTVGYPNAAKILGLNFKHDTAPYNGGACAATAPFCPLTAATNAYVVYPNSFALTVTDAHSACTSGYASCTTFKAAGASFNMKLQALCFDGTTLATDYVNGSSAIVLDVGTPLVAPSAGDTGSVGTTSTNITSGGEGTFTQTWSEVGVATFKAEPPAWFGRTFAAATTENIGRFYPHHFTLKSSDPVPAVTAAIGTWPNAFTYMDQPSIKLIGTLEARALGSANALGGTGTLTTNYHNFGAGLNFAPGTPSLVAENANDGVERWSGPPARLTATLPSWNRGQFAINAPDGRFARLTTGPDGPFDTLQFGIKVADNDTPTIALENLAMNAATTGDCATASSCDAALLGAATRVRFGHLRLINFYGSELLSPRVEYRAEYWDVTRWTTNTLDTGASATSISCPLPFVVATCAIATGGLTVSDITGLTDGVGFITFSTAAVGSYDIAVNLNSSGTVTSCNATNPTGITAANKEWLQGYWSSNCNSTAAWQQDPNARVKLGSPKAPYIYLRERY